MKYADVTLGRVEAVWNKLGGRKGVDRFLRGELKVCEAERSWFEHDNIIDLGTITSDGTTGPEWIKRLERKGFIVCSSAKNVLMSEDFKPTNGVASHIVVLKGDLWKNDEERTTKNIYAEAEKRGLAKPNPEIACLIREKFSDKKIAEMLFFRIVVMHEPIIDSDNAPVLLQDGMLIGPCMFTAFGYPGSEWHSIVGFAFVLS